MANQIIPVAWEKPLRKSAVNTLDKVNELIDFINDSDIHEFSFIERDAGESVQTGTSTQLADLTVYGKSVQDGTPTPDNPVPVQVVGGKNLLQVTANTQTINGITFTVNVDDSITADGTASATALFRFAPTMTLDPAIQYTLSSKHVMQSGCWVGLSVTPGGSWLQDKTTENRESVTFTNASATVNPAIRIGNGVTVNNLTFYPQLEQGTHATPYAPYGCIGLQTGDTLTPIDLQGHTLAGLPDGTRDVLRVDSAGRVWIEKHTWKYVITGSETPTPTVLDNYVRCSLINAIAPEYESLGAGATITGYCTKAPFDSLYVGKYLHAYTYGRVVNIYTESADSTGAETLAAFAGAEIVYPLATPQTIELGYITPPAIPSGSVVSIDATLTPIIDLAWWTEDALPQVISSLKSYVDTKIAEVNSRIDTLHGISPAYTQIINSPDNLADITLKDDIIEPDELTEAPVEEKEN